MEIVTKNIEDLIPYEKNPRRNKEAVDYVAKSIQDFGFKIPVVIDKENVIVCGHTRVLASKKLGLKEIPCIIADDLTPQQIKAFRLADNKVGEISKWDTDLLLLELEDINLDMTDFGFDFNDYTEQEKQNERHRTDDAYNLDLVDISSNTNDFWQMPVIENNHFIPTDLIDLNVLDVERNCKTKGLEKGKTGIHFYVDDYKFERIWKKPEEYLDVLRQYECVLSPDFSLYLDMPMPMKIWNTYRSRQIGQFWQKQGIKVIPTLSWAEKETFEFCFKGIPKNSIVSVSTMGAYWYMAEKWIMTMET